MLIETCNYIYISLVSMVLRLNVNAVGYRSYIGRNLIGQNYSFVYLHGYCFVFIAIHSVTYLLNGFSWFGWWRSEIK